MHPTPALGGYPKMKHSNLLKKMNLEHEAYMGTSWLYRHE